MQRSNFFESIRETPWLMGVAMVLALVPAALAARARWRGAPVGERALWWWMPVPVVALGLIVVETRTILDPPEAMKIDPRFWAFLRACVVLERVGPTLTVAALGAMLAPELRRGARTVLPAALAIFAWSIQLRRCLVELLMSPNALKLELWTRWQPVHAGLTLLVAAAAALALVRGTGPARWVAAAVLPPLLIWPGWTPWVQMATP